MRGDRQTGSAPDYTNAFLVSVAGILFTGLWVIAAVAGFVAMVLSAIACDWLIRLLGRRI